mmetsp:Transcript_62159/g.148284  ORF Transcript_62159/g.148284 Transcript_62159/m.148284 type:complete len:166 (-) Transcript_62159:36-533(-)
MPTSPGSTRRAAPHEIDVDAPSKRKRRTPRPRAEVFVVPWAMFSLTLALFALCQVEAVCWIAYGFCSFVTVLLTVISVRSGLPWLLFSIFCGASATLGLLLGVRAASLHPPEHGLHRAQFYYCLGLSGAFGLGLLVLILLLMWWRQFRAPTDHSIPLQEGAEPMA